MIDLTLIEDKTFDIKISEDLILNVRKPNNTIFKDTNKILDLMDKNDEDDKIIDAVYMFLTKVLNRNTNDKKFSQNEIADIFSLDIAMYVIGKYNEWVSEIVEDINF